MPTSQDHFRGGPLCATHRKFAFSSFLQSSGLFASHCPEPRARSAVSACSSLTALFLRLEEAAAWAQVSPALLFLLRRSWRGDLPRNSFFPGTVRRPQTPVTTDPFTAELTRIWSIIFPEDSLVWFSSH